MHAGGGWGKLAHLEARSRRRSKAARSKKKKVMSPRRVSQHEKSALFFAPGFYETLRYAKKVSEPPPLYIMTGGARLAFSDTHKHHTYRKM